MLDPSPSAAPAESADGSLYECEASPDLIAAFDKRAVKVTCSETEVLFSRGEPGSYVYHVRTGAVTLTLPIANNHVITFRAESDSLIGLPAAFSNQPYSMSAIAMRGSEVAMMGRDKFCDLIANNPALSLDVLKILAAETRAARVAIVETGMKRRGVVQST